MGISANKRKLLIGGISAVILIGVFAILLGGGCSNDSKTMTTGSNTSVAARTSGSTQTTATTPTAQAIPEDEAPETPAPASTPAPAPAPAPAPPAVSFDLLVPDYGFGCDPYIGPVYNCYAGTQIVLGASARRAASVTVTISGPEAVPVYTPTDYGPHQGGFDPADYDNIYHDWTVSIPGPTTPGIYTYTFTGVGVAGETITVTHDEMGNPLTFQVVAP